MKKIYLSDGVSIAVVDDEDYERLASINWHASNNGYTTYAKSGTKIMHRLIMNAPDDKEVDHIDGNGLNNQRSNLRICTRKQNARNRQKHIKGGKSSHYKGVSWYDNMNAWKATITVDDQFIHLGFYETDIDAAIAYDKASIQYFGRFARLNFPDGEPLSETTPLYKPLKTRVVETRRPRIDNMIDFVPYALRIIAERKRRDVGFRKMGKLLGCSHATVRNLESRKVMRYTTERTTSIIRRLAKLELEEL